MATRTEPKLTEQQIKQVTDYLEEHYPLVKKSRLYFFIGGALTTIVLALGISHQSAMRAVEKSAASNAVKEIAALHVRATTLVSELEDAKTVAAGNLKAIRSARSDAPNKLDVVVPQLSQRVSSLEARTDVIPELSQRVSRLEAPTNIIRVYQESHPVDIPSRFSPPHPVDGGVVAAIIGVKNRTQPTIVTGDVGVIAHEPPPATRTGRECDFWIANGTLYANGACHGPLQVVYLFRPDRAVAKPTGKPSTKPSAKPKG